MTETNRLVLQPLTHGQLVKYIRNDQSLEEELGLRPSHRAISPELKEALEETILPNVADSRMNYLYATLWTLISKEQGCMVGDLCFVGEPNADGEVEIGYGTYEAHRGHGYMTEAVGGMIAWARQQAGVVSIFAATEQANLASFAVLEKNGFLKVGAADGLFQWRRLLD